MFWDDDSDSKEWQIFKNLTFLKMPMTNKDRDDAMPTVSIIMVIVLIVIILFAIFAQTIA